jgi:cyclohexa-1,5-dienecarbonyl-CoA hydratase
MSDFEFIKVSRMGQTARLVLARPPLNVLNIAMLKEINAYLSTLENSTDCCALVISGEGKNFCAGVDVPEHKAETIATMLGTFHEAFRLLHRLPMPTVCAVQGGAYGGGMELALFCDIVLAADDLKIGVPEITLGVFPPVAIAQLATVVGAQRAAELVYTGKVVDAREAERLGLVGHVYPAAELGAAVEKLAAKLGKLSAFALGKAKAAFRAVVSPHFVRDLDIAEKMYLNELMTGLDPVEGLAAFMEKRPPVWKHR